MKTIYLIPFFLLLFIHCSEKKQLTENELVSTLDSHLVAKNSYVKIPMKQLKSGHLSLVAKVNRVNGRFILDTGSSSTIIDRRLRKKFRLITQETQKIAKTAGGSQLSMKVSLDNILEFEKLKLRNVKISLVDLKHINYSFQSMGMLRLDGIIGSDILKDRKAVIDYENLVIYLKK
jgi:predicted aspartyl protease